VPKIIRWLHFGRHPRPDQDPGFFKSILQHCKMGHFSAVRLTSLNITDNKFQVWTTVWHFRTYPQESPSYKQCQRKPEWAHFSPPRRTWICHMGSFHPVMGPFYLHEPSPGRRVRSGLRQPWLRAWFWIPIKQ